MQCQEIQKEQKIFAQDKENINTRNKYKCAFNSFNRFIKQENIKTIDRNILREYKAYLSEQNLTNNTINQYLILIKSFLVKECEIKVKETDRPKIEKHTVKYITIEQYEQIQKHLKNQLSAPGADKRIIETDITIINLLFNTGLRIHEALKLETDKIKQLENENNNSYSMIIKGKGNKKRQILIKQDTYIALTEYIKKYSSGQSPYVFESIKTPEKPISSRTIERHFQRIAKELDAESSTTADNEKSFQYLLKPHSLRHSFALVNLASGLKINDVQKLLGHNNITTTQIYTELTDDDIKKRFDAIHEK